MEIKTEFLDVCTNKIDKLLNHFNNQKRIIYALITLIVISIFGFVVSVFQIVLSHIIIR